jgi:colanic acid/amylovoran biosynthesis protein
MNLLVFHIPNTLNYGSMMMAENFFFYLSRELSQEDLELIIITPKPDETSTRLRKALEPAFDNIIINTVEYQEIYNGNKIEKALAMLLGIGVNRVLSPIALSVDGVLVLGGDDFSEDYGYIGPLFELLLFNRFIRSGIDVAMCGQTIGPFYSWRKPVFRYLLAKVTEITARDPITYEYLCDEFKLKNVSLGADLAFLPLAREKEHQEIKLNQRYFTIVTSELIWKYAKDPDRSNYINCLTNLAIKLLNKFNDYQLLILPHVVTPDINDDRLAGRDLYINLKRQGVNASRMVFLSDELLPYQARQLLRDSQFVITGRMHAAISSFACGVPPLSLSYSRKYWGIIGEYLGMKELIIDVRNKLWNDIEEEALNRIDYINDNYEEISSKIKSTVQEMQDKAIKSIREMKRNFS